MAATCVYVSNADGGDIGVYYASVRLKPFTAYTYAIDPETGALEAVATGPLAESLAYISTDRTGRYLLGASYGGASPPTRRPSCR